MHFATFALASIPVLAWANQTPVTVPGIETETSTRTIDYDFDPFDFRTPAPELPSNSEPEDELKKRQAPGQIVGAGVPNSPEPTQMSPITTFLKYGPDGKQTPVVYTQTFNPVPDQWDQPKSGSIGMGNISGQIGVVKTKVRRNYVAEATAAVKRGVHALEKRKKSKGSGSGGNAASGLTVPLLTVAGALGMGVLAVFL